MWILHIYELASSKLIDLKDNFACTFAVLRLKLVSLGISGFFPIGNQPELIWHFYILFTHEDE